MLWQLPFFPLWAFLSDKASPEDNFSTAQKIGKGFSSPLRKIVLELNFLLAPFQRSRAIVGHDPSNKCITNAGNTMQFSTAGLCNSKQAMAESSIWGEKRAKCCTLEKTLAGAEALFGNGDPCNPCLYAVCILRMRKRLRNALHRHHKGKFSSLQW